MFKKWWSLALLAFALMIGAVFFLSGCGGGEVSSEQLHGDLETSSIATGGNISADYVSDSPYQLTGFSLDSQSIEKQKLFGLECSVDHVQFSATVGNENFQTQLTGIADYSKLKGEKTWGFDGVQKITSSTTTPLRGVSGMTLSTGYSSWYGEPQYTVTDFSSTLEDNDGSFTSLATQKASIDKWFATSIVTTEQSFVFNSSTGWQSVGAAKVTGTETQYKLQGKTYTFSHCPGVFAEDGPAKFDLTFTDLEDPDNVQATYAIDYDPPAGGSYLANSYGECLSVHETGTVQGKIEYQTGAASFSFVLNDKANAVTFSCSGVDQMDVAGIGSVDVLKISVMTNFSYRDRTSSLGLVKVSGSFREAEAK